MRHMIARLDVGECVEVFCTEPGPLDGAMLGYAITLAGGWDAWQVAHPDPHTMRSVARNVNTLEEAINAIVK